MAEREPWELSNEESFSKGASGGAWAAAFVSATIALLAAGLPWCSTVTLKSNGESLHRIVGPAIRQLDQWALPILVQFFDDSTYLADHQKEAERLRHSLGLNAALPCTGQGGVHAGPERNDDGIAAHAAERLHDLALKDA